MGQYRKEDYLSEYTAWCNARSRCHNPKTKNFHHYGGRGIKMCSQWRDSFDSFIIDMGRKPTPKHTLDRVNNDLDYSPENCEWRTMKHQERNKRNNRRVTIGGETKTIAEWSELTGVRHSVITNRLNYGWSPEESIKAPVHKTAFIDGQEMTAMEIFRKYGGCYSTICTRMNEGATGTDILKKKWSEITYNCETRTIAEWANIAGISPQLLRYRIRTNWPIDRALNLTTEDSSTL